MKTVSELLIDSASAEWEAIKETETSVRLDKRIGTVIRRGGRQGNMMPLKKGLRIGIAAACCSLVLITAIYAGYELIPSFRESRFGNFLSFDFGEKDDDGAVFSNRLPEYIPDGWEIHESSVGENAATTVLFNSADASLGYVTIIEQKGSETAIDAKGCTKTEIEVRDGVYGVLYEYPERRILVFKNGVSIFMSATGCSKEELLKIAASIR